MYATHAYLCGALFIFQVLKLFFGCNFSTFCKTIIRKRNLYIETYKYNFHFSMLLNNLVDGFPPIFDYWAPEVAYHVGHT